MCLCDHLARARKPQDRCTRILSRVLTSPHCLSPMLAAGAPALLVRALLLDKENNLICTGKAQTGASNFQRSYSVPVDSKSEPSSSTPLGGSTRFHHASTDSSTSLAGSAQGLHKLDPKLAAGRSFDSDSGVGSLASRQASCDAGSVVEWPSGEDSGARLASVSKQLLGDIGGTAASPYGEGRIAHTFLCLPDAVKLTYAASLLFLQSGWFVCSYHFRVFFLWLFYLLHLVIFY